MCMLKPKSPGIGGKLQGSLSSQLPKANERQAEGRSGASAPGRASNQRSGGLSGGGSSGSQAGQIQPTTVLTRGAFRAGRTGGKQLLGQ